MPWNNSQPSPTQNISTGQATILNNFQFLGNTSTLTGQTATGTPGTATSTGGYFVFPNGMIVQFFTITNGGNVANNDTYSFLIPFTQVNSIQVILQPVAHPIATKDVIYVDSTGGTPVTINNFTVRTTTTWGKVYVVAIGV